MNIKVQSFSLSTKWLKFVLKLGFGNMSKVSNNSISANCAFCLLKNRPFSSLWTNLWTFDYPPLSFPFCSLFVMIRYLLISIMCLLHSACTPPPPPPHLQILHTLLFSNPLGRTVYFQKDMKTIPYAKFAGQTECIMEDSKIISGKKVRAHPLRLFLIILLYRAMLPWDFFWPRTDESSGVENNSYVHVSERPHSD